MKHPSKLGFNYKCRLYANVYGYYGTIGGWIYHKDKLRPVCQGWNAFYKMHGKRIEYYLMKRYERKIKEMK